MERRPANALRILGIVATVILVIAGCCLLLLIAWLVIIRGGLTRNAMIFHPRAANSFVGALLAAIALVTTGVLIIRKLAREMVRDPARSLPFATISGPAAASSSAVPPGASLRSLGLLSVSHRLSPRGRKTIDRLVLALGAWIAISAVALLQVASRALVPRYWTLDLLSGLILTQAPYAILIYALLKRPGRRTFTLLIALLAVPILQALFNPLLLFSYGQIYTNHADRTALALLLRADLRRYPCPGLSGHRADRTLAHSLVRDTRYRRHVLLFFLRYGDHAPSLWSLEIGAVPRNRRP